MNPNFQADTKISKTLSWLLRHAAVKEGLQLNSEGFAKVDDVLKHPKFIKNCSVTDILRVVNQNDKQRFALHLDDQKQWLIKANQGHSIKVDNLDLEEILLSQEVDAKYPKIIHGTYYKSWNKIKSHGLHHMQRNHIHFATGLPGAQGVISGMRKSCELYIYIDLKKALEDNLKFYKSANSVILSPGNSEGYINKKYFIKVIDAETGREIY